MVSIGKVALNTRRLPSGKHRLLLDRRVGAIVEVAIVERVRAPGCWYSVLGPPGTTQRVHCDDLYAPSPAAHEFLSLQLRLEAIEREAHQAGLAASEAVRVAAAPEIAAARERIAVLQRSGQLV